MMGFRVLGAVVLACTAWPVEAADPLTPIQVAAACAPLPASSLPDDALQIVGVQDTVARLAFGPGELVIIGGGTSQGLQLEQRFYVRRRPQRDVGFFTTGPRGANTVGWLRIVAARENTAIGFVEFACDALVRGDILQPYADPVLPAGADETDTTGEPDFMDAGSVLFGDNERQTASAGEFLVTDRGSNTGTTPGSRFAIYRDVGEEGIPLASIGEAIAVSVYPGFSVIRVTRARDAIFAGDLLVPRRRP
jgi:hypothetical protein